MSKKYAVVKLVDMKETFYVRQRLNDDHVRLLKRLYESGATLPPLVWATDGTLIDGRHRKHALLDLGRTEALCEIVTPASRADAIAMAVAANSEGSLTQSPGDMSLTIRLFLEEKASTKDIVTLISQYTTTLPAAYIRRYVRDVKVEVKRTKVRRALSAIRDDNLTVEAAARQFHVDTSTVKAAMKGVAKEDDVPKMAVLKTELRNKFGMINRSCGKHMQSVMSSYEDGSVDDKFVREVLDDVSRHLRKLKRSHNDWRARFAAMGVSDVVRDESMPMGILKSKAVEKSTIGAKEHHASKFGSDEEKAQSARLNLGLE